MIQNMAPQNYNKIIDTVIYDISERISIKRAREKKGFSGPPPNVVGPRPMAYMAYW